MQPIPNLRPPSLLVAEPKLSRSGTIPKDAESFFNILDVA